MTAMSRPGRGCGPAVLVGTGRGRAYDGHMKRPVLLVLLVLITVAAVVAVWWSGRQPAPEGAVNDVKPFQYQADTRPTVEVYGDSISQGDSSNFSSGNTGPTSWVSHLGGPDGLRFVGGFAQGGEGAETIRNYIAGQHTSDVVIYEIATNDLRRGVSWDTWADHTLRFHEEAAIGDDLFAVVLIGPMDDRSAEAVAGWNDRTRTFAEEQGWAVLDPWDGLRDDDNRWVAGMSADAVHPNKSGAQVLAANMAEEVRAALSER